MLTQHPPERIPKIIWMYWHQGLDKAPTLVHHCVQSWKDQNPEWQLNLIDQDNLHDFVELKLPSHILEKIGIVKQSNLLRLQLLAEYGGVWADATTMCRKPLDAWLPLAAAESGFFAFYRPGRDRLISSWFLASEKNSPLIVAFLNAYTSFFLENSFNLESAFRKRIVKLLGKIFNKSHRTTRYWLLPLVTKGLKIYPYFILHYLFESVVRKNPECQAIWEATSKISAIPPHKIQRYGMLEPLTDQIKAEIDSDDCPVYKLSYHFEPSTNPSNSVLSYLFKTTPTMIASPAADRVMPG
jgi:hypothetical protein